MFATRKRAAIGLAVASAGSTVVAGAPSAGAASAAPERACAVRGLTPAEAARGERSVVHCAATPEEARAAADGDAAGEVSTFAQAAIFTAGFVYAEQRESSSSLELRVTDCGAQWRSLAPPWRDQISGIKLIGCSTAKLYKGDNLDGDSTFIPRRNEFFGLQPAFDNQIHSISFKA